MLIKSKRVRGRQITGMCARAVAVWTNLADIRAAGAGLDAREPAGDHQCTAAFIADHSPRRLHITTRINW
jgi:hypothetical protein